MPQYSFIMKLSENYIIDFLDISSKYYSSIMYYHPTGYTIYSSCVDSPKNYATYLKYAETYVKEHPGEIAFSWSDQNNYIAAEYSPALDCTFMQVLPLNEIFSIPIRLTRILLGYCLLTIGALILFCLLSSRMLSQPLNSLLSGYKAIEKGNFDVSVPESSSALEFSALIQGFNKMASHLKQSIDQLYEYELYSQKMELKQLQMQMNPHFLYNTYFILDRLIRQEDMEQAAELSSYLGNYFQYITRNARDMVPLSLEWKHAQDYLQIQSIRFATRITYTVDALPERYNSLLVPRLILQPLLENALEHGLKDVYEGGRVEMRFSEELWEEWESIQICITDNGQSLTAKDIVALNSSLHEDAASKEYTALHNILKRLQLMYAGRADVQLSINAPCGLCVYIRIPAQYQPENAENTNSF